MKKKTKKSSSQMKGTVNKKLILIVCIVIVLFITAFILLSNNSIQTQKQSVTTRNTEYTNAKTATGNSLSTYHGDSYTFSYPKVWTQNQQELNNNTGILLNIQPSETNTAGYSHITVEVLNAQTTSMSTLTRIFNILHYTETNSTVAGITALKYRAVLPTQNGDFHSTAYIFQQNEKIYTMKLEYIQPNTNEQLESQFSQLLKSFSIQ